MTLWPPPSADPAPVKNLAALCVSVRLRFADLVREVSGMPAIRRATDEPGEDHWNNGDRETDWRKNTPRSALIVAIYVLMGAMSFLGSFSYWVLMEKINDVQLEARDQKWDVVIQHAQDISELKKRREQDEAFREEVRREFDRLRVMLAKRNR